MTHSRQTDVDRMLDEIQRGAFGYFLHETNPANGLVLDKTCADWPASIAAVGLALTAYPVGVERGFVPRAEAAERTLTTLRFFWRSKQGPSPTRQGTRDFTITFSIRRPARARGSASCRRSTRPCCWAAC